MIVNHFRELRVYQKAFECSTQVFELSKEWPKEEMYSLTGQIRRSSRSVCANIAEAWRKRRYVPHFISKLTDADAEAAETQTWLDTALSNGYLGSDDFERLDREYEDISGGLVKMMSEAESWCGPANAVKEETVDYETNA